MSDEIDVMKLKTTEERLAWLCNNADEWQERAEKAEAIIAGIRALYEKWRDHEEYLVPDPFLNELQAVIGEVER